MVLFKMVKNQKQPRSSIGKQLNVKYSYTVFYYVSIGINNGLY